MTLECQNRIYIEKAHQLHEPPDLFAGRIPDILKYRFSWEDLKIGDRLELTALDAQTEEPKSFCFELLSRRIQVDGGLGEDLLVKFVGGSDDFHFYTSDGGTSAIALGLDGLIGVCGELIKNNRLAPRMLMIDGGGVGLGRDLAFEDVRNRQGEKVISLCVAKKILTGHHFCPQEPIDAEPESGRARFLLRDVLTGKRSHYLTLAEFTILQTHPDFSLQVNQDIVGIGRVIYSTSIADLYLIEIWSEHSREVRRRLVVGRDGAEAALDLFSPAVRL